MADIRIVVGPSYAKLFFAFDQRVIDLVKTVPGRRYHDNQQGKYWRVSAKHVPDLAAALRASGDTVSVSGTATWLSTLEAERADWAKERKMLWSTLEDHAKTLQQAWADLDFARWSLEAHRANAATTIKAIHGKVLDFAGQLEQVERAWGPSPSSVADHAAVADMIDTP